jgi:hypothetical protein
MRVYVWTPVRVCIVFLKKKDNNIFLLFYKKSIYTLTGMYAYYETSPHYALIHSAIAIYEETLLLYHTICISNMHVPAIFCFHVYISHLKTLYNLTKAESPKHLR